MFSRPLMLPLIALCAPVLGAQTPYQSDSPFRTEKVKGPIQHITVDLKTGQIERTPQAVQTGTQKSVVNCFSNLTTTGSLAVPGPGEEWVDWGTKACSTTGLIDEITIGYATMALDPGSGGVGADLTVAFYDGTTGFSTLGTELTRISLTALPAGDGTGFFGFIATIILPSQICLKDGAVGWSYVNDDGLTGPLLIAVGSDPTGTIDAFDIYGNPATSGPYAGTFNFGNAGNGSFYFEIGENDGSSSTVATRNGSGVNPDIWTAPVPLLSQNWATTFDLTAFPSAIATAIGFTKGSASGPVLGFGELLIDITDPNLVIHVSLATPGGLSPHDFLVPKLPSIIGDPFFSQGAYFDGAVHFTNAIDFTLGL